MSDLFSNAEALPFDLPTGPEYGAVWNEGRRGYDIRVPHGELFYAERYFAPKVSDRTVEYLLENDSIDWREADWRRLEPDCLEALGFRNIRWKQDWINFYGKRMPLPRLTSWYGDPGASYTYSGIRSEPNPWNKGLQYLKEQIEQVAGTTFNSVLLNWYRDGDDYLSWHADNETELGRNPVIASANFGAARDFQIRRNDDHGQKITLRLDHGTLLVMAGELQHFWQHSVPKRKRVRESRFNMTFRRIRD